MTAARGGQVGRESAGAQGESRFKLRDMRLDDLAQVGAIESSCFASPWSASAFRFELESEGAWVRVAIDRQGLVLGYMLARLYVDAWHILDLAVAPHSRRRGVAWALLTEFLDRTASLGIEFTLEVRPSNQGAMALYQDLGFEQVGRRRGYYPDTGEDALLMTLRARDWAERRDLTCRNKDEDEW